MSILRTGLSPAGVIGKTAYDYTQAPPVEWIDLGKTFVDTYGRPLKPSRKAALDKMTFDPAKAGVIEVSEREDGRYALLDGMGRKHLALKDGVQYLVGNVHTGLTYEEEAALFVIYNSERILTTAVEEYNASYEAKVPLALAIQAILDDRGLKISYGHSKTSIQAPRIMVEIAESKDMGLDVLADVLDLIHDAWHDSGDDTNIYGADIMSGMAQFWIRYRAQIPNRKILLTSLRNTRPQRLRMDAALITAGPNHPHKYTATGMAILNQYNYKRSANKLDDWVVYLSKPKTAKAKVAVAAP